MLFSQELVVSCQFRCLSPWSSPHKFLCLVPRRRPQRHQPTPPGRHQYHQTRWSSRSPSSSRPGQHRPLTPVCRFSLSSRSAKGRQLSQVRQPLKGQLLCERPRRISEADRQQPPPSKSSCHALQSPMRRWSRIKSQSR